MSHLSSPSPHLSRSPPFCLLDGHLCATVAVDSGPCMLPRSYIWFVADMRGVWVTCEQPNNSILYFSPDVDLTIQLTRSVRMFFWFGGWGGCCRSPKPSERYTTLPAELFERLCKDVSACNGALESTKEVLYKKTRKRGSSTSKKQLVHRNLVPARVFQIPRGVLRKTRGPHFSFANV